MTTFLGAADTYEARLNHDLRWALSEGSRFFEGQSGVHAALRKVTRQLDQLGISYAVAGGMALFAHGVRRFTEDVDILVSGADLKAIHEQLDGRGYVRPFPKSKNLRETEHGVRIEFLIEGQYPGDGKPKAISFPDPSRVAVERDGIRYLNLESLVELKLASGLTSPDRLKDLADVQALIKTLQLTEQFGDQLNAFVRPKYVELWQAMRAVPKRYVRLWRNEPATGDATAVDQTAARQQTAAELLEEMLAAGVRLEPGGTGDDYDLLVTDIPDLAQRFDMQEASEYWGLDEEDS
ncbi:MAG: hypothetical protein AB7U73_11165 [Pirellulales bacterium]